MLRQLLAAGAVLACVAACEDRSTQPQPPAGGVSGGGGTGAQRTTPESARPSQPSTTTPAPSNQGQAGQGQQGGQPAARPGETGASPQVDAGFVREAANVNQEEIALGQLASQNAQDPEVKRYGQTLVQDHTKANQSLSQIAEKNNIQLPSEPGQSAKATQDELSKLSGAEFDRRFLQEMIRGHTQAIAQFERQSSQARDPQMKQFIDQTLPDLREHLRMAQDLQSRLAKPSDEQGGQPGGEPATPPNGQPGGQPGGQPNGGGQPKGR